MWVRAEDRKRELRHVGFGDDHAARGAEPVDHRCIGLSRRRIREHFGSSTCRLAGNIEQIFDAHDRAVEWAKREARTGTSVRGIGGCTRRVGIYGETGASTLAPRIGDASEGLLKPVT